MNDRNCRTKGAIGGQGPHNEADHLVAMLSSLTLASELVSCCLHWSKLCCQNGLTVVAFLLIPQSALIPDQTPIPIQLFAQAQVILDGAGHSFQHTVCTLRPCILQIQI